MSHDGSLIPPTSKHPASKSGLWIPPCNKNFNTSLHQAILDGDSHAVADCMTRHPDHALAANRQGDTPLHLALKNQKEEIALMLLAVCPKAAGRQNLEGVTPLHLAAENGDLKTTRILLAYAPETSIARNQQGQTPMDKAGINLDILQAILLAYTRLAQKPGPRPHHHVPPELILIPGR